jgi:hypothetical protein
MNIGLQNEIYLPENAKTATQTIERHMYLIRWTPSTAGWILWEDLRTGHIQGSSCSSQGTAVNQTHL